MLHDYEDEERQGKDYIVHDYEDDVRVKIMKYIILRMKIISVKIKEAPKNIHSNQPRKITMTPYNLGTWMQIFKELQCEFYKKKKKK